MAENMCGPSNAAKGLAQHLDRDRSLQQDRVASAGPSGVEGVQQGFRSLHLGGNTANQQFSAFQGGGVSLDRFPPGSHLPVAVHSHPVAPGPRLVNPPLPVTSGTRFVYPPLPADMRIAQGRSWATDFHQGNLVNHAQSALRIPGAVPFPPGGAHSFGNPSQDMRRVSRINSGQAYSQQLPMNPLMTFVPPPVPLDSILGHPVQPPSYNLDFDFEAEMRAWMSVNGPSAEAQANAQFTADSLDLEGPAPLTDTHEFDEEALEPGPLEHEAALPAKESSASTTEQAEVQRLEDLELALAAQNVLDSVADNETTKFKESSFVKMMRDIASQKIVVRDNNLVDSPSSGAEPVSDSQATEDTHRPQDKPAAAEDATSP
ncbi:hypothetical protein AAE478_007859 [Parahypoxylon ruwenzoriense]